MQAEHRSVAGAPPFDGPVLTPADIERRLRVTTGRQDLNADELAGRCRRLVILGGPGSGKTWFAKRTARRCAEEALRAMAAGATVPEVELPLYTTCSRLQAASGDIRGAAVSSALDQLGDRCVRFGPGSALLKPNHVMHALSAGSTGTPSPL
jgi:hypothetical protein